MRPAGSYFTDACSTAVRRAIEESGGNEVLFAGGLGEDGLVERVVVLARGHGSATPAVVVRLAAMALEPEWKLGVVAIHNHPSGALTPSEADVAIAARLAEHGIGSLIVDNEVGQTCAVVEPFPATSRPELDLEEIAAFFAPGGELSRALPAYEEREGQARMAMEVARAFADERLLLVEAGTGTGKSLAYLMPAAAFALVSGEKVIVSTYTLNLQDQIESKDLPLLARALARPFRAEVMKGRHNYVGLRKANRLREAGRSLLEGDDEEQVAAALFAWIDHTTTGDRRELGFPVPETLWSKVASEADNCLRGRCPTNARCFYYQARRRAVAANLIVVNHSLLFSDLALRGRLGDHESALVLPAAGRIVLDEAHHVEDVAATHFGCSLSRAGVLHVLGRLVSARHSRRGALPYLVRRLGELNRVFGSEVAGQLVAMIEECCIPAVQAGREALRDAFAVLDRVVVAAASAATIEEARERDVEATVTLRIREEDSESDSYAGLHEAGLGVAADLSTLLGALAPLVGELEDAAGDHPVALGEVVEMRALVDRLRGDRAAIDAILPPPGEPWPAGQARWIERREGRRGVQVTLTAAPIEVGRSLGESLHDTHPTVVFTSATLGIGGSFNHLKRRLGLVDGARQERVQEVLVESPFDFARNCLLAVADDVRAPDAPGALEIQAEMLVEVLRASGGHAFVLNTSHATMRRLFRMVETRLIGLGMTPLLQEGSNRSLILESFRRLPAPVLFGADSFWEGVDVQGDTLRLVVILRLPFRSPSEPLQAARLEALAGRGEDPFHRYSLPQAILRLKQGFGRLIRTQRDRGVVLVLDGRMAVRAYGKRFFSALPPARRLIGPWQRIRDSVASELSAIVVTLTGMEDNQGRKD